MDAETFQVGDWVRLTEEARRDSAMREFAHHDSFVVVEARTIPGNQCSCGGSVSAHDHKHGCPAARRDPRYSGRPAREMVGHHQQLVIRLPDASGPIMSVVTPSVPQLFSGKWFARG